MPVGTGCTPTPSALPSLPPLLGVLGFALPPPRPHEGHTQEVADTRLPSPYSQSQTLPPHRDPTRRSQSRFHHQPLTLKCHPQTGTALTRSISQLSQRHSSSSLTTVARAGPRLPSPPTPSWSKMQMGASPQSSTVPQRVGQSLVCYTCPRRHLTLCHLLPLFAQGFQFPLRPGSFSLSASCFYVWLRLPSLMPRLQRVSCMVS